MHLTTNKLPAHEIWANLVSKIESFENQREENDILFEKICREIWSFSQDEGYMEALGFKTFYDIFHDPEVIQLIESPAVLYKIDLRNYGNQNRFYNLLWWDSELSDEHLLRKENLTKLTQRPGLIGAMKELLSNLDHDNNAVNNDEIIIRAKEILSNEDSKEGQKEERHTIEETINGDLLDLIIDGIPTIRFKGKWTTDPYILRFRSRTQWALKDRWIINVPRANVTLLTEKGMEIKGLLLTNDENVLKYLSSKGFKIELSE